MIIGTILHGALGDVYEQALAFKLLREKYAGDRVIAFFSREDRLQAFRHFDLEMFDEIHTWKLIPELHVDRFDQFQVRDHELRIDVLSRLPAKLLEKFDLKTNKLPWHVMRDNFSTASRQSLKLSALGQITFRKFLGNHGLVEDELPEKYVGYLWRYRKKGDAVNPRFQRSRSTILESKSELLTALYRDYGLKVIAAGLQYAPEEGKSKSWREESGTLEGELRAKFAGESLALPKDGITYLAGLGFAAELEIMSRTKFQLLMPSGFSEPVWLRNHDRTILVDPPPYYMLKLLKHRMPLFNNLDPRCFFYNNRNLHQPSAVLNEIRRRRII